MAESGSRARQQHAARGRVAEIEDHLVIEMPLVLARRSRTRQNPPDSVYLHFLMHNRRIFGQKRLARFYWVVPKEEVVDCLVMVRL